MGKIQRTKRREKSTPPIIPIATELWLFTPKGSKVKGRRAKTVVKLVIKIARNFSLHFENTWTAEKSCFKVKQFS